MEWSQRVPGQCLSLIINVNTLTPRLVYLHAIDQLPTFCMCINSCMHTVYVYQQLQAYSACSSISTYIQYMYINNHVDTVHYYRQPRAYMYISYHVHTVYGCREPRAYSKCISTTKCLHRTYINNHMHTANVIINSYMQIPYV